MIRGETELLVYAMYNLFSARPCIMYRYCGGVYIVPLEYAALVRRLQYISL